MAARLRLPTTPVAIVEVSEELIRLTPELVMELPRSRMPCFPGLQFGSRYPGDPRQLTLHDLLPDEQLRAVENLHDFAGMLVFDKWTCNTDGRQTVFVRTCDMDRHSTDGRYRTLMIDQGFCFNAGEWNFPDAPLRGLYARNRVYEGVTGMDSFEPWLTRLESEINLEVLVRAADDIPPEWYESDRPALDELLERLNRRRSTVRETISSACKDSPRVFPNWRMVVRKAVG
jgi:hypothetical protein